MLHLFLALVLNAPVAPSAAAQAPATSEAPAPPGESPSAPVRGLRVNDAAAFAGYTLYSPLRSGTAFLLDMTGEVAHEWKHGLPPMSCYLQSDGRLMMLSRIDDNPVFFGGGIGGRITEYEWDGTQTWEFVLSTEAQILHHDIEPLPNGNVLAIAWNRLSAEEAIALGRDPRVVGERGLWPDSVLEIQPTRPTGGKIVWEWRAVDHLVQDFDPSKANFGVVADRPERIDINGDHRSEAPLTAEQQRAKRERERELRALGYAGGDDDSGDVPAEAPEKRRSDWLHTNSVDYNAEHDLIALSTPEFCEIWILDHSTSTEQARGSSGGRRGRGGDLLYRWGNPRHYGAGEDGDRQLFYQHQPDWIRPGCPGAGNLLVFNNGSGRSPIEHSSVDELVLPFDPQTGFARDKGKPFGPAAPVWSYSAPEPKDFYSFFISGAQRLPNGNTFICSGKQGRLFEVTADKRIVWEFWNPWGGEIPESMGKANPNPRRDSPVEPVSVFRATRLAPDHPGLAKLRGAR